MIAMDKIIYKLRQLDEFLETLQELKNSPSESFLSDKILIGAAKYYLQISIECCLDVANHIIASEGFRAPTDYADTFKVLEENGILQPAFSLKLRQMAKFRNRLVHLYGEIDNAYVFEFLTNDLQDIEQFKTIIATNCLK